MKKTITLLTLILSNNSLLSAKTWTSADGSDTFEAKYVSHTDSSVTVIKGGKKLTLKQSIFSAADQQWIAEKAVSASSPKSRSENAPSSGIFEKPFRIEAKGKPIVIEVGYAYPTFVDLNKDGVDDLVVGGLANSGEMFFFEGAGTSKNRMFKKSKLLTCHENKKPLFVPGVK